MQFQMLLLKLLMLITLLFITAAKIVTDDKIVSADKNVQLYVTKNILMTGTITDSVVFIGLLWLLILLIMATYMTKICVYNV